MGGVGLASDFDHQNHLSSIVVQLARYPRTTPGALARRASVSADGQEAQGIGTPPSRAGRPRFDGASLRERPDVLVAPVSRRSPRRASGASSTQGHRAWIPRASVSAEFHGVGESRASGWIQWAERRPRAGHCRRLWERLWERRLELGANTYRVLVPPTSTARALIGSGPAPIRAGEGPCVMQANGTPVPMAVSSPSGGLHRHEHDGWPRRSGAFLQWTQDSRAVGQGRAIVCPETGLGCRAIGSWPTG